ncbi:MAG TPA: hypothetical protein VLK34_04710 [Nocardioidaceae bacterium]|nr:hypothetical protein [Nocardioidaceae bacterium]
MLDTPAPKAPPQATPTGTQRSHSWTSEVPPTVPTAASLVLDTDADIDADADADADAESNADSIERPDTTGHSVDESTADTVDIAVGAAAINGRRETLPQIPMQSKSSTNVEVSSPSVDALDLSPIFDAAAFKNLRERLFGVAPPQVFPSTPEPTPDAPAAQPDSKAEFRPELGPPELAWSMDPMSEPRPFDVGEPPIWIQSADDTGSAPQERPRSRTVLFAAAALVLAVAAIALAFVMRSNASSARATSDGQPPGGEPIVTAPAGAASSDISIDADGAMQVEAHLVLPAASSTLTLAVPDPASNRAAADYVPRVTDIEVTAAGSAPVSVDDLGPGATSTVDLGDGSTAITLTYRVTGAVVHSEPSPPQRRAVLAMPLTISAGQPIMSTIAVPDAINFGCWGLHAATSVVCGEPTRDGWQVALTTQRADAVVIAQVDLPR